MFRFHIKNISLSTLISIFFPSFIKNEWFSIMVKLFTLHFGGFLFSSSENYSWITSHLLINLYEKNAFYSTSISNFLKRISKEVNIKIIHILKIKEKLLFIIIPSTVYATI